jgi:hypothetical protein
MYSVWFCKDNICFEKALTLDSSKNPTRCNSVSKFIISHLYEAQHVLGDTPSIIRSLKLLAASGFAYVEGCWTYGCWTANFYEAQHVSGDTPSIIRSLKLLAASGFAYVEGCWMCGCWTANFYEAQRVSGDTPPIIGSLKLY